MTARNGTDLPTGADMSGMMNQVADKNKNWNAFLVSVPQKLAKVREVLKKRAAVIGPQVGGENRPYDVVIIGYGSAGASAALEAAATGARVLVMDTTEGGGATQRSGGVIYLGGGTKSQTEAGFQDDADNMYRCLKFECELSVDDNRLRAFCAESKENYDWLSAHGVPFSDPKTDKSKFYPKKCSLPPGDTTLYWSGNETAEPWASLADPAPRGHWPWMPGTDQFKDHLNVPARGHVLFNALSDAVDQSPNIDVRTHCKGVRAVMDGDSVVGLTVKELPDFRPLRSLRHLLHMTGSASPEYDFTQNVRRECSERVDAIFDEFGVEYNIDVRGGVVICAGGFFFNDDMVQKHAPDYYGNMALGSLGDDGSGILLGEDAGGATGMMGKITSWKFMSPPKGFLDGIMVDRKQAKRFTNEDVYNAKAVDRQFARADGRSWLILDSRMMESIRAETVDGSNDLYPFQRMMAALNTEALALQADSLPNLARACGLPKEALRQTVDTYNDGVRKGSDAEFGKNPEYMRELSCAPFYAVPVDARVGALQTRLLRSLPRRSMELLRYLPIMPTLRAGAMIGMPLPPTPSLSLGGLRVDHQQRVLQRETFSPITGLYAAGRSAVGVASGGYVSGMSIADAIFSGRHAGRQAALRAMSMEFTLDTNNLALDHERPRLRPVAVSKL